MFVCALMLHTPSTFNTFDIIFSILSILGLVLSSRWKFYLWAVLNTCTLLAESPYRYVLEPALGGDFLFHVNRLQRFDEATTRFYAAEIW